MRPSSRAVCYVTESLRHEFHDVLLNRMIKYKMVGCVRNSEGTNVRELEKGGFTHNLV